MSKPILIGIGQLDVAGLLLLALSGDLMAKHNVHIVDHHEHASWTVPIITLWEGNAYLEHEMALTMQIAAREAEQRAEKHNTLIERIAAIQAIEYAPAKEHKPVVHRPKPNSHHQKRHHKPMVRRDIPRR